MKKQTRYEKQIILFLLVILSVLVFLPSASSVVTRGMIIQSGGSKLDLVYDTNSDSYQDKVSGVNADAALRVYGTLNTDVANKYVGVIYAVGVNSGNLQYVIVSRDLTDFPLQQTGSATSCGASCNYADTSFSLQIASSLVGGLGGNPGAAWFPAYPYMVISGDDDASTTGDNVYVWIDNSADGKLTGSYTGYTATGTLQPNYDQATGMTSFNPTGTSPSAAATDPGHNSVAYLMCGICNDTHGDNCSDTTTTDIGTAVNLNTSIVLPGDSYTTTRYAVVNGIGTQFCIGPDLDIDQVTLNDYSEPPGAQITVTARVANQNNVNVTQTYNVTFYYDAIDSAHQIGAGQILTTDLGPGETTTTQVTWDTTGILAGAHTVYARLGDSWIGDCDDSNDHGSVGYTVELVYLGYVDIDGNRTLNFSNAGRPYNVTFQINDSNGQQIANTTIRITEKNGISILAPLQTYTANGIKRGVKPVSIAEVITDSNGMANLVLIPTGNKLYTAGYEYTNITEHLGNYSIYYEIFNSSGTELQLVDSNGVKVGEINMTLLDLTATSPTGADQYSLSVFNQDTYVKTFLNFAYQIFATARQWIAP